jgi:hypothetical protein
VSLVLRQGSGAVNREERFPRRIRDSNRWVEL